MDPKSLSGVTYLSNAEIQCSERQLLSGFQFESLSNKKFRYNFECTKANQELTTETISNPWTDYLGWYPDYANSNSDVNFLDRQNVDCADKGFLASLQMEVNFETKQLRYIYQCRLPKSKDTKVRCEERKTFLTDAENYFLPSLRHQHVRCEDSEVLKSFLLKPDYAAPTGQSKVWRGNIWYDYSCCKL